jgi:ABC-2 type transport system permease protein
MDVIRAKPEPVATSGGAPSRTSHEVRVITPEVNIVQRLREIWAYRELLLNLVGKELKVKYKGSVLGFVWSMLNPALILGVYYLIFGVILPNSIKDFAIFLMAGLLVYNLFSYSTLSATGTMVANSGIVKKVSFPREILALASVSAGMVFFFFQSMVLLIVLVATRYLHGASFLPQLIPAMAALLMLSAALAVLLSAVNVYFRDTQHLVEIFVGALWFWATPIVYPYEQIVTKLAHHHLPTWLPLLNPLTDIVLVFQRAIYGQANITGAVSVRGGALSGQILPVEGEWWYLWHVLVVLGLSTVLLVVALKIFGRLEGNFAEEL